MEALRARFPRRARRSGSYGGAAVEFAIVLPIFLAVVFGIIDWGWYYYQRFTLAAAVRDGIRFGVTFALKDDPWTQAQTRAIADLSVSGSPINSGSAGLSWGPSATASPGRIAGDATTYQQYLTLSATYTYTPLVGFIPFLPTSMTYQMSMLLEVQ
jgi:hypothetical protein